MNALKVLKRLESLKDLVARSLGTSAPFNRFNGFTGSNGISGCPWASSAKVCWTAWS